MLLAARVVSGLRWECNDRVLYGVAIDSPSNRFSSVAWPRRISRTRRTPAVWQRTPTPVGPFSLCHSESSPALVPALVPMERSGDWLIQARSDLDHARHDLEAEFYEWACFSAQQAAEKAVKGAVQHHGGEAWGHSVADLLEELAGRHDVSSDLLDGALELDKSYIPTRYPDAHQSGIPRERYTKSEANRHIDHAERILTFCERLVADA